MVHAVLPAVRHHKFRYEGQWLYYCPDSNDLIAADEGDHDEGQVLQCLAARRRLAAPVSQPHDLTVPPAEELAQKPLLALDLVLTHQCNLDCDYCLFFRGRNWDSNAGRRMSQTVARRAVDLLLPQIAAGRNCRIRFTGAEPLLNQPVLYDILDYAMPAYRQAGARHRMFSLLTNGVALTDAVIDRLSKYPVSIQISLDGPASTHDAHRPLRHSSAGSHALVEKAAIRLRQRSGELHVAAVWTPGGPSILERVRYFEEIGATSLELSLQHSGMSGKHCGLLQAEHYQTLLREYEQYIPYARAHFARGQRVLHDPFHVILSRLDGVQRIGRDCDALSLGSRTVDIDGTLYPCYAFVGMPPFALGDVFNGPDVQALERWAEKRRQTLMRCEGCWAWPLCLGHNLCEHMEYSDHEGCDDRALCDFLRAMREMALGLAARRQTRAAQAPSESV